ncbi:hypothetical protein QLX08_010236 [Tetragonisca angustula]|uniref:Uncharacterized protein n=1 Tax=Tetragonisca angustula TaxID=166442 RepID=A0AAW0ZDV4_9HYME
MPNPTQCPTENIHISSDPTVKNAPLETISHGDRREITKEIFRSDGVGKGRERRVKFITCKKSKVNLSAHASCSTYAFGYTIGNNVSSLNRSFKPLLAMNLTSRQDQSKEIQLLLSRLLASIVFPFLATIIGLRNVGTME